MNSVFSTTVDHTQWNGGTIKVGTHVWTYEENIGNNHASKITLYGIKKWKMKV